MAPMDFQSTLQRKEHFEEVHQEPSGRIKNCAHASSYMKLLSTGLTKNPLCY
jgi:hypothetical protein